MRKSHNLIRGWDYEKYYYKYKEVGNTPKKLSNALITYENLHFEARVQLDARAKIFFEVFKSEQNLYVLYFAVAQEFF